MRCVSAVFFFPQISSFFYFLKNAADERKRSLSLLNKVYSRQITIATKGGKVAADDEAPLMSRKRAGPPQGKKGKKARK